MSKTKFEEALDKAEKGLIKIKVIQERGVPSEDCKECRFNPYHPISYVIVSLIIVAGICIAVKRMFEDMGNPFEWTE